MVQRNVFTDEGSMTSYIGDDINFLPDVKWFTLSQSYLIEWISKAPNFYSSMTNGARDEVPSVYHLIPKDVEWILRK